MRKESLYFLQLGYDPIGIPTAYQKTNTPANKERLRQLSEAQKEAEAAHKLARQTMMERITRGTKPFKKGEKVWLESKHLKLRYETKKLVPKREGCQGTSLAVCTPLYTLFTIHSLPSFYFAYIHLLLFGYHLNLSCSQQSLLYLIITGTPLLY